MNYILQSGGFVIGNSEALDKGSLTISAPEQVIIPSSLDTNGDPVNLYLNGDGTSSQLVFNSSSTTNLNSSISIDLFSNAGIDIQSGVTTTINGAFNQNGGNSSFLKNGAGTLILTNSNNNTGATINGGTLDITTSGALQQNATVNNEKPALEIEDSVNPTFQIILNASNLVTNGTNQIQNEVDLGSTGLSTITTDGSLEIEGSGGPSVQGTNGTNGDLELSGTGSMLFDSDVDTNTLIEDASQSITLNGSVITTGNQDYKGNVTFQDTNTVSSSSGTVIFENTSSVTATDNITFIGNINLNSMSSDFGDDVNGFGNVTFGNGTTPTVVTLNNTNGLVGFGGADVGTQYTLKDNSTLILNADLTGSFFLLTLDSGSTVKTTGTHILSGGSGIIGGDGGSGATLEVDGTDSLDLQAELMGLNFTKTGTGTLLLDNSNFQTTGNVNAGTVTLLNNGGAGVLNLTVNTGATVDIDNIGTAAGSNITLNGGTLTATGSSELQTAVNLSSNSFLLFPTSSDTIQFDNGILANASSICWLDSFNAPTSGVSLPFIDLADGGSGNLTVNAAGDITQSDVLAVSGTSSFNAGAGAITLNNTSQSNVNGNYTGNNLGGAVNVQ